MNNLSTFVNLYPVGAIYISEKSISPATLFGGTWNAVKGGLLACAGSDGYAVSGSTGGSKTISVDQMPSHNHRSKSEQVVFNIAGGSVRVGSGTGASFYQDYLETKTTGGAGLYPCAHLFLRLAAHSLKIAEVV